MERSAPVAGAVGFIGHNLVRHLKDLGYWVRGVDSKRPDYEDGAPTQTHGQEELFPTAEWP